ncbi:MAG TPA: hypothetical protein PLR20_10670 [Syntrophales bacterium]|nr:hypothetical protein [Syntrophales bacterium]HOX94515.1 hypothetical protein [Syntrophales bacterium]HPI57514.1 hypothetical protein [Syntrophales bacterium]HPN24671.1 hypothetical protein [Syntrophales bacterium]HQM29802.1 hypothetical protein [Syntrophales bacterium]
MYLKKLDRPVTVFSKEREGKPPVCGKFFPLLLIALLTLLTACQSSRTYQEGVLAEQYRMMSNDNLRRYQVRLNDEIVRISKGGPVPAGVDRVVYLEDLQTRWKDVEAQIQGNISRQRREEYNKRMDLIYGY